MPRRCRQTFTLRKVYGFSQKEIAARLSIAENTVEQHLMKAARRCAEALFDSPLSQRQQRKWLPRLRPKRPSSKKQRRATSDNGVSRPTDLIPP